MRCFFCNFQVRWNNDFDTEDTYPDSKHTVVSYYTCDECDTEYEVFHDKKDNILHLLLISQLHIFHTKKIEIMRKFKNCHNMVIK